VALKRGKQERATDVPRLVAAHRRGDETGRADELAQDPPNDPERTQRMCGRGRHLVQMPDLRLQSPSLQNLRAMAAAASDPHAQHWLGWTDQFVQQARQWTGLLEMELGEGGGRLPRASDRRATHLAAIDASGRRLAGAISFDGDTSEVGGWLAPGFRGRGLGAALFTGAAEFAHHHLGVASVLAGTEDDNAACIRALTAAGFIPAAGPATHTLENGRVTTARWFRHESPQPALCAGSAAPGNFRLPFLGPSSRHACRSG
jgi:RimJ/RimL family protein N-acetyltransferase